MYHKSTKPKTFGAVLGVTFTGLSKGFLSKIAGYIQELESIPKRLFPKIQIKNFDNNNSERVCIFAAFQKKMTSSLRLQLSELKSQGFYIIFVSNLPIDEIFEDALRGYVGTIIIRDNYGRDFAGYRDGYRYAKKNNFYGASELLFMNDTIIFPLYDTSTFWEECRLMPEKIVGSFKSFIPSIHLQSFFILCKDNIFRLKSFALFWDQYKNPNARVSVIMQGEIGLSRYLVREGIDFDGFINPIKLHKLTKNHNLSRESKIWRRLIKARTTYAFEQGNPSHHLALISFEYLDLPMIKKDLLSKKSIHIFELLEALEKKSISSELLKEVLKELLIKKLPMQKSFFEKLAETLSIK